MEYCAGGSLLREIYPGGRLKGGVAVDQNTVKRWSLQLVRGLAHLHSNNMLHRDVKPDNILLCIDEPGWAHRRIKIADMGLATVIDSLETHADGLAGSPV
jgi:serine/threonine protein kinase